jgi:O-antigen/teichoic acid export membrane protein
MPDERAEFGGVLKSAAALAVGRQLGALALMGAVVALPRLSERGVVDDFLWVYFASLFLSSILNLGLERVTAPLVARAPEAPLGATMRPILLARAASVPVTVAALWILFAVVGVHLPSPAWALSLVWVISVQAQGVAFAGLRAGQKPGLEPVLGLTSRLVEAVVLVALAAGGMGVTGLVAAMAAVETVTAVLAVRALGPAPAGARTPVAGLPWRTLGLYTGVEVVGFAYLRVDVVLVGILLGAGPGATYSLVYRVVDALTGLATPVLLLLFPYAARKFSGGHRLTDVRERALRLVPAGAAVAATLAVFAVALLTAAVPRFEEGLAPLRLLLVSVPLYFANAIELHLRSAEDRNREVLTIGAGVLALNVVLNLVLIPWQGLEGAAWALVVTETVQAVAIVATAGREDTGRPVSRWGAVTLGYAAALLVAVLLVNAGAALAGTLVAVGLVVAAGRTLFVAARRVRVEAA